MTSRTKDWRTQGSCTVVDPELFFPAGNTSRALSQAARAKAVCSRCPVALECLHWAVRCGEPSGIWGGLTEHERSRLGGRHRTHRPG
ncbi:WhiB family transcriptional regulator [Streptomyces sp. NPDC001941]|uniref:WhiB family transcriptional regulator n=1 Tax=Streptomyces sp. NPDC001941 TaxID=3154659 RepID=UPI0033249294